MRGGDRAGLCMAGDLRLRVIRVQLHSAKRTPATPCSLSGIHGRNRLICSDIDTRTPRTKYCDMTIDVLRQRVDPICREYDVRRRDVFGSTAKGSSDQSSDVDLLVEFHNPDIRAAKRFFGLLHTLEDDLGCPVDLLTISSLRNPYFRQRILAERIPIYEG